MEESFKLIGEGNTAQVYDMPNNRILKLYRHGLPESLCRNEFDKTKKAYEILKNVPEPIEIIYKDNRIGAVYEKIDGITMMKSLLLKPWQFKEYSKKLANYHIGIRKQINGDFPTVKEKLSKDITSVDILTSLEKEILLNYIEDLPENNILCHFDFHPGNIMIKGDDYIIIDWMTACKGDPLVDVARTSIMFTFGDIPNIPKIINYLLRKIKKGMLKIYLNTYMDLSCTRIEDIKKWELPVAAARLCEWLSDKEKDALLSFVRNLLSKTD